MNEKILEQLAELHLAQAQPSWFWDFLPILPGLVVSIFAVWAVHQLTRRRERERAVFRVYRALSDMVNKACDAAALRWITDDEVQRKKYIAETIWRIHQIGLVAEQLRQISSDWRVRPTLSGPPIVNCPINIRSAVIEFRRALTGDPFAVSYTHLTLPTNREV